MGVDLTREFAAFAGGIVAVASPCTWPFFPFYTGYLTGSARSGPSEILRNALGFVLGFSVLLTLFGAGWGYLGEALGDHNETIRLVSAGFLLFFGAMLLGVFEALMHIQPFRRFLEITRLYVIVAGELRIPFMKNPARPSFPLSVLFGAIFGFAWTPCAGPVIGSIIALALNRASTEEMTILLAFFSAGLAVPFLGIAVVLAFSAFAAKFLPEDMRGHFVGLKRWGRTAERLAKIGGMVLQRFAGAALIVFALVLLFNLLPSFTRFLLEL